MTQPRTEWDATWDDDWPTSKNSDPHFLNDEQAVSPLDAVNIILYGHPKPENGELIRSDVEADVYQDYMTGSPEPGDELYADD